MKYQGSVIRWECHCYGSRYLLSTVHHFKNNKAGGGSWGAQSVKCLILSSGLDLRVMSSTPVLGSTLGVKPT